MRIINFIIFFIILYISKKLFILFKFKDQKNISNINHTFNKQNLTDYNNIQKQFGPMYNNDTSEFGIFKLHPFSHPNDIDIYLAKINNNLDILDCGSGLLGLEDRINEQFKNTNIHIINKVNKKFKKRIIDKINFKKYNNITSHFIDFKNIKQKFDETKFDRILFIESLSFNKNIENILSNCFNILKDNGILYIRTTIRPYTKSNFINNNISDIESKIEDNILYHENVIYFLQKAGFRNISFSSIPLIFSNNYSNIFFTIPLIRYKIFNFKNIFTMLSLSQYMYVVTK